MADEKNCPHCGKPVPPTALGGICPECMLKAGLASQTEGPGAIGPQGTKVVQPPPSPAEIASLFPQLEILECLGRGGMGVVYKARQPRLNRLVALKILARDKEQDGQFAERFTREAQALARLNHPNIVTVHDFGCVGSRRGNEADVSQSATTPPPHVGGYESASGGLFYLVMEYVDGLNLRQLLLAGKMPPDQALTIVPKICEALQYAHDQGIVHRDIKPENILLDKKGQVKIADFGIAKMLGAEAGQQSLTGAKDVVGTPHYMAPEQIEKPQTVDHRADIYSLGVVFYEMLTGELPLGKFQPPSSCARGVQIDVRLDEVVLHALEKEPGRRYQQASQVKTAVETIAGSSNQPSARAQSEPNKTPLASAALFFAGLSGILGITAFCYFPHPSVALVWSILVAALAGITLGIRTRKTRPGKQAVVVGSINAAIWLAVALAVNSTTFQMHVRELACLLQGGPRNVIAKTIRNKVGQDLTEVGARYDDLQVTVAVDRHSATPFKVSYRGLRNFKWGDGGVPAANGEFIMEYIGGGQWQGKLGGMQFTVPVGHTDNFMLPFVNDPPVIGEWESVDFVPNISDFNPDKPNWTGDKLFLKGLTFLENGRMSPTWWTWTKGVVMHHGDLTASRYEIREIKDRPYLFFEWKSGDVTISGMKPCYFVLKKKL